MGTEEVRDGLFGDDFGKEGSDVCCQQSSNGGRISMETSIACAPALLTLSDAVLVRVGCSSVDLGEAVDPDSQ